MDIIQRYSEYRNVGLELNNKIIKRCVSKDLLQKGAKLLGLWSYDTIVFEEENDMASLMDFTLNELTKKSGVKHTKNSQKRSYTQNCNQWYLENYHDELSAMEIELLTSNNSSYTSLFEVLEIHPPYVILKDLFNKGKESIKIIDINMSQTAEPHYLLFFRLGRLADFHKTSGMLLLFPSFRRKLLLKKYERFIQKYQGTAKESAARFIFFFKLRIKYGLSVLTAE